MNIKKYEPPSGSLTPGLQPPAVIAPKTKSLFADRAARFERLAQDHALSDYLRFLGRLTRIQHELLQAHPEVALPEADAIAQAREHNMPVLPANGFTRDPVWRAHLAAIAERLAPDAPEALQPALAGLADVEPAELERLADAVLRTEYDASQAARLPFIAAALQVYWTWMAAQPAVADLERLDVPGVCPCCGSLPVASVVQTGDYAGARYLHCSLCNTEWNLVRVNCSACGETDKVSYRFIEGQNEAVRAEVCDDCQSYLKIMLRDKDAEADPVADDLATLGLDILVDEAGYVRSGPNPLFVPGEAE